MKLRQHLYDLWRYAGYGGRPELPNDKVIEINAAIDEILDRFEAIETRLDVIERHLLKEKAWEE